MYFAKRTRAKVIDREGAREKERLCPGDTHTRSANNRRALSLCGAWYYKHQNGPQSYINAALHLRGPGSFLFLSFPSCSCFPADRRATLLVSYELFSPFHRGRTFRGKTSIKPVPLERYEALVFRLFRRRLVLLFPLPPLPISLYFPFDPSLSNAPRARQLVGPPVYV